MLVLFNAAIQSWIKKDSNSLYILRHYGYSFDGAEVCELLALFILNHLGKKFGKESIGLYRDDGLAIIKSKSARLADKTRKELHKIFEQFDIKISAVNFFDVTFDLNNKKYRYRKHNDDPLHISKHFNDPPCIIKQLREG